jgi:histidinol dehydrogenase
MKRSGWTQWSEAGLRAHGASIMALAEAEELTAHADSVRVRLQ